MTSTMTSTMTDTWADEADLDSAETEYDSLYDGGESYDESVRSRRRDRARRIARARELELARSRQRARQGPASPARTVAPATAIRALDLETKVQGDVFRQALAAQEKRMSRNEYATVLGALTSSFVQIFNMPENKIARTALQAGHLALLAPTRKGTGFEAVAKDPRTLAAAGLAGMLIINDRRTQTGSARQVNTVGPDEIATGDAAADVFLADVLDGNGKPINTPVVWTSNNPAVATIDPVTGKVTGHAAGVVVIAATAGEVVRRERLRVTPATSLAAGAGNTSVAPASSSR